MIYIKKSVSTLGGKARHSVNGWRVDRNSVNGQEVVRTLCVSTKPKYQRLNRALVKKIRLY